MENLKSFQVKELTQVELFDVEGGFWIGPPPKWVIHLANEVDQAVGSFIRGVEEGSKLF
jgi:hypothetical protein